MRIVYIDYLEKGTGSINIRWHYSIDWVYKSRVNRLKWKKRFSSIQCYKARIVYIDYLQKGKENINIRWQYSIDWVYKSNGKKGFSSIQCYKAVEMMAVYRSLKKNRERGFSRMKKELPRLKHISTKKL